MDGAPTIGPMLDGLLTHTPGGAVLVLAALALAGRALGTLPGIIDALTRRSAARVAVSRRASSQRRFTALRALSVLAAASEHAAPRRPSRDRASLGRRLLRPPQRERRPDPDVDAVSLGERDLDPRG
jgi:hypothetical protein